MLGLNTTKSRLTKYGGEREREREKSVRVFQSMGPTGSADRGVSDTWGVGERESVRRHGQNLPQTFGENSCVISIVRRSEGVRLALLTRGD